MLCSFVFIRFATVEEAGQYFYLTSIAGLLVNISLLGNGTYINKAFVDSKDPVSVLSNLRYFPCIFIALTLAIVLYEKSNFPILVIITVVLESGLIKAYRERIYCSYSRVFHSSRRYGFIQFSYVLSRLGIVVIFSLNWIDFHEAILLYLFTSILSILFFLNLIKKTIFPYENSSFIKYINNGSVYFFATIFTMGYDYAPTIALRLNGGQLSEIAIFGAFYKVSSIFILSIGVFTQSLLPFLRRINNKDGRSFTIIFGVKIILVILFLYTPIYVIFLVYDEYIIRLLLGNEYVSNSKTMNILLLGIYGSIVNFISFSIFQAIDMESKIPILVAPCALLNVVLCFVLSYQGAVGVSVSLSLSLLTCSIISIYFLLRIYRSSK